MGSQEGQAALAADPILSPQFDFTSCQGVLFVLLMTLFFSGLILAILLPFQYVSLWVPRQAPQGGRGPTGPRCRSLPCPPGKSRSQAPQPAILCGPSWHLSQACWQCKQTRRLFLSGLGTCRPPQATSGFTFPILLCGVRVGCGAFKPWAGKGVLGLHEAHQTQRGLRKGLLGAPVGSAKSKEVESSWPGRREVGPWGIPTSLECPPAGGQISALLEVSSLPWGIKLRLCRHPGPCMWRRGRLGASQKGPEI